MKEDFDLTEFTKQTCCKEFNKLGKLVTNSKQKVFAKRLSITTNGDEQVSYFILFHENKPYDFIGPQSNREPSLSLKLHKVTQSVFDNYLKYLQTKKTLYFTMLNRSYMNA
jgi:hypothetical protein